MPRPAHPIKDKVCIKCEKTFTKPDYVGGKKWTNQLHCSKSCALAGHVRNLGKFKTLEQRKIQSETCKRKKIGAWLHKEERRLPISERYYDYQYKYWVDSVKRRDGNECKIANTQCSGRIETHHILNWKDYPELRYQLNNGITLCMAHHPHGRKAEVKLSPYFQELIKTI